MRRWPHTLVGALIVLACFSAQAFSRVIDGVAIIVNRDAILVSEINEAMMPLIKEYRARYTDEELKKKMNELRETIIDQAIENKLVLQVAKKQGIITPEPAVDSRIEAVKRRFPSEDAFLEVLAARGITYREYRDQVAEQVLVQETVKYVVASNITVLDNEIQEYYESHRDEFTTEPQVQLAQIFLEASSESAPENIEAVRHKAEQLRILIEEGTDFSELAKKYSQDPYAEKGGIIGLVRPDEILPDLQTSAFSLKTGEVSSVIQTSYGFHILKAIEATPARKVDLEEARPFIEERLTDIKRNEEYQKWIKTLKEESYIDIKI